MPCFSKHTLKSICVANSLASSDTFWDLSVNSNNTCEFSTLHVGHFHDTDLKFFKLKSIFFLNYQYLLLC